MSTFGNRLKQIRKELVLSQEALGKAINTTKSYISLVERDKNKLSAESFEILLLKFNVNINYLLGEIGTPFLTQKNYDYKNEIRSELEKILSEQGIW